MKKVMHKVLFSSASDSWNTPLDLFEDLDREFHFDLDPCASSDNAKCSLFFDRSQDGLLQDWKGHVVFCNPPYGRVLKDWVRKCYLESLKPNTTCVLLIPSRTDTSYFHDYIIPFAKEIRFIRGRLHFSGSKNPAPFPSVVVVFGS